MSSREVWGMGSLWDLKGLKEVSTLMGKPRPAVESPLMPADEERGL